MYGFDLLKLLATLNLEADIDDIINFAVTEVKLSTKSIERN